MTIVEILIGAFIAVAVFLATFWSGAQVARHGGLLRWTHLALLLSVIALFAVAELNPSLLALRIAAGVIGVVAVAAIVLESGWPRLLPVIQLLFACAIFLGLPQTS